MSLERVVIFGATSAIAQAVARRLAARGARLHLVGRDPLKLEAVRADLVARGAPGAPAVTTAVADLDDISRHRELIDEAERELGTVDAALIAQGTLSDQAACEKDFARTESEWLTNFIAPSGLAAELANRMEARGAGTIAVIGSVAGDRGRKTNYVYGTAKAALATFLQGLRGRLHAKGVAVVTVKPGFVDTPMTASFRKGLLWASPDKVAAGIVRAMERGTPEVYIPWFWWPIMFILRHLPERIFVGLKI
jgi:decaprenylphospho-beta-D-erythro-pentofuranosid-2-ulose 2-reductase